MYEVCQRCALPSTFATNVHIVITRSFLGRDGELNDSCFRHQECRLGSSSVRVIPCDHIVMSQGHKILPRIVAHLCWGNGWVGAISVMRTHTWVITVLGMAQTHEDDGKKQTLSKYAMHRNVSCKLLLSGL